MRFIGADDTVYLGKGHWKIQAYQGDHEDYTGIEPVWEFTKDNIITTSGKNLLLDRLFGLASATAVNSIGVGTDSTAAAAGQTQLNPTVAGTVLILGNDSLATRSGLVVTAVTTFSTAQANFIWREVGAFTGTTNGTSGMLNRIVIGALTKDTTISVVVTLTFTQS